MKKVILLTVCLVFVFVGFASASVSCQCKDLTVNYSGQVKFFCCLLNDYAAKVDIYNSCGKRVDTTNTNPSGAFSDSFTAHKTKCGNGCCLLVDSYTAKTSSCYCVMGNKGVSNGCDTISKDACEKAVTLSFGTICADLVSCSQCR